MPHSPAETTPQVFILHENSEWIPALLAGFEAEGIPVEELLITGGAINLDELPPPGVYWSRLSASAHTRGNGHAKEYARSVLAWAEASGRRVVNGTRVVEIEVSKVRQHALLTAAGFDVPRTIAVFGNGGLVDGARRLQLPFITKHNQGGKGLGVRLFATYEEFESYVGSEDCEAPVDGITLLQEYLVAAEPFITRVEFIGGRFHYAVRVDISTGNFQLCPADACVIDPLSGEELAAFSLREGLSDDPLIRHYEEFLADNGIEVAGIEFIETSDGRRVTYDINTNTNYNPAVEATTERPASRALARYLGSLL